MRPDDDAYRTLVSPGLCYVPQLRGGMPKQSCDNGEDDDSMLPPAKQERPAKTHHMSTRSTNTASPDPSVTRQQASISTEKPPARIRLVYESGKIVGVDKRVHPAKHSRLHSMSILASSPNAPIWKKLVTITSKFPPRKEWD